MHSITKSRLKWFIGLYLASLLIIGGVQFALRDKLHKTVLFVTHDIFEAVRLGDRIAVMNKGRIEQLGNIQEPHSPKLSYAETIQFLETHNQYADAAQ